MSVTKRWSWTSNVGLAGATVLIAAAWAFAAFAEPLVQMNGGKAAPGVVTSWSGSGDKVELTVKDGTDAKAVAEAIQSGVPKVKAKVQAGKVVVTGKSQDELLKALADVDFGGDDFGALAAAASEGDEGSGSSLRAKKTAELAKVFADQTTTALGKVTAVKAGAFPNATVTVQVLRGPTGAAGTKVKKGAKIAFTPVLKKKGAAIDWTDENTQLNAGAWYLKAGDKVRVKLGKESKGGFEAEIIDRE